MTNETFIPVSPAPCLHIYAYYNEMQRQRPCIAHNLLRIGYKQWAFGVIEAGVNNLFEGLEE